MPLLLLSLWLGCARPAGTEALPALAEPPPEPRNIVLMIGDGMGPQQVGLLEALHRVHDRGPTAMARLADDGVVGLSLHHPADGLVTDSACSATQLATGAPSRNGMIGMSADGRVVPNLRETAAEGGRATGVVSDTRLTHATPAAFLAHVPYRAQEDAIAAQIVASDVDVVLSGGARHFDRGEGARSDGRDLVEEARAAGFAIARTTDELATAGPRVLGLFAPSGMPDALTAPDVPEAPTLAGMTQAALDRLDDDPDGFFLVVEGGQIDWAAHANDAGWMLAELKRFDEAIGVVHAFAASRSDTLVVVTADHETGGFGISTHSEMVAEPVNLPGMNAPWEPHGSPVDPAVLSHLERQTASVFSLLDRFEDLAPAEQTPEALAGLVDEVLGHALSTEDAQRVLSEQPMPGREGLYSHLGYARSGALAELLSGQTGLIWATSRHTHTPVPVTAFGPGADAFGGFTHHTEVGQTLRDLL